MGWKQSAFEGVEIWYYLTNLKLCGWLLEVEIVWIEEYMPIYNVAPIHNNSCVKAFQITM